MNILQKQSLKNIEINIEIDINLIWTIYKKIISTCNVSLFWYVINPYWQIMENSFYLKTDLLKIMSFFQFFDWNHIPYNM